MIGACRGSKTHGGQPGQVQRISQAMRARAHLRPLRNALGIPVAPPAGLSGLGDAELGAAGAGSSESARHQAAAGHRRRPGNERLPAIELPRVPLHLPGSRNSLHPDAQRLALLLLALKLRLAAPATTQGGTFRGELAGESHVRSGLHRCYALRVTQNKQLDAIS